MKKQNVKFWGILTVIITITVISSLVIPVMAAQTNSIQKPNPKPTDPQPTTPQQKVLTAWYQDQLNSETTPGLSL